MTPVVPEPFELVTLPWESQPGRWSMTVCLRATFALVHGGECEPLEPQASSHTVDGSWDEAHEKILHLADLVPFKPRADVVVLGHVWSPWSRPVRALVARVRVGSLAKAVRVVGDRPWRWIGGRWVGSEARPFTRMPLRWEGALRSAEVPVGLDPQAPPVDGAPAGPTFESVDGRLPGFGLVPPGWPQRYGLVDEDALEWALSFAGGGPVAGAPPPRFPFQFFNVAPADQQLDLVRPGAPLVLEHLSARWPMIATHLPSLRPRVARATGPGRRADVALRCDTLWIDSDRGSITMLWRGLVDLDREGDRPELTITAEGLPPGSALRAPAAAGERPPPPAPSRLEQTQDVPLAAVDHAITAALPFGVHADESPPVEAPRVGPPAVAPPVVAPRAPAVVPPAPAVAPPAVVAPPRVEPARIEPVVVAPPTIVVAPPSPLAVVTEAAPSRLEDLTDPDTGGHTERVRAPVDPDSVDLATCAAIAAELAQPGVDRSTVLGDHGLDEGAWSRVDRRWKQAIDQDARKGSTALLEAYDDAFLEALARRSAPIDAAAYARIKVAQKRGDLADVLESLRFPRIELLRLTRVWTRRTKADAALAAEVDAAVQAEEKRG